MVPLRLRWFSDGLFVVRVTANHEELFGGEVLLIGGSESEEAFRAVSGVISADNDGNRRRRSTRLMRNISVLHQLGLAPEQDRVVFTIRKPSGDTVEVHLVSTEEQVRWADINTDEVPLFRQRAAEPYWYHVIPEAKTLFFKFNQCVGWRGFRDFAEDMKRTIEESEVDRMVVDFRGNGGGNSALFSLFLLKYLQRHDHLNREGHLYSVIDGGTFSSAVLNSVALERRTSAITVGEPTGGKPNHFGEIKTFSLPNSGLVIQYSTKYFEPFPELGDAPSFLPEIRIPFSSSDYFRGRDPVLASILSSPVR